MHYLMVSLDHYHMLLCELKRGLLVDGRMEGDPGAIRKS